MVLQFQNGLAAELYIASWFAEEGYEVFWPMQTQSRADFVVSKNGKFEKVQCKKATWSRTGKYEYLQSRISSRNKGSQPLYKEGDFDLIVFTDLKNIWVAPISDVIGLTSVCLGSTKVGYKSNTKYQSENWKRK